MKIQHSRTIEIDALALHREAYAINIPEMRAKERGDLSLDIAERGIAQPIEVLPGTTIIIDGRERWEAAKLAGCKRVPIIEVNLNGDHPVNYRFRRKRFAQHLNRDQLLMLASRHRDWMAEEGRKKGAENLIAGGGKATAAASAGLKLGRSLPLQSPARQVRLVKAVAEQHGVSVKGLEKASRVARCPDLARRVDAAEMTIGQALGQIRKTEQAAKMEKEARFALAAIESSMSIDEMPCRILTADCHIALPRILREEKPRLIFADPPYNEGVDYGGGPEADKLDPGVYQDNCRAWAEICAEGLADDGSLWVLISKDYAPFFGVMLKDVGLHYRDTVYWYERFGQNCAHKFNRCCRTLYRFDRDPDHRVWHPDAVMCPSARQTEHNDKRANPAGKVMDDVWMIDRLVSSSERIKSFPTQLPEELVRRVIASSTDVGDLVVDPFGGSGTTAVVAMKLGRRATLTEINPKTADVARQRLHIEAQRLLAVKGSLAASIGDIAKRRANEVGRLDRSPMVR